MIERGKSILQRSKQEIIEHINYLDDYESISLLANLDSFEVPNFSLAETERLKPFETFLEPIHKFNNRPCVYFIEIHKGNTKEMRIAYKQLKFKNKAGLKKEDKKIFDTQCLYVGKSQKSIIHRLKVHFGYKNTTENGLQLLHWAKKLDVSLKIHIFCFHEKFDFLLPMYERKLNKELKPLIGYL